MTDGTYIAAGASQLGWRYEETPNRAAKVLLLTAGRVAVIGNWSGAYGQQFIAWCPLPKRDKAAEERLGVGSCR